MTKFIFKTDKNEKSFEIGLLPNPEIKMQSVKKSNSIPPLEKKGSSNFTAPKGITISSVNQTILSRKGISSASFRLTAGLTEYATRPQIVDVFVALISYAEAQKQKANYETLKSAFIEILDAQPNERELNKIFAGEASAEFYVGNPDDGDPSRLGEISVQWNLNLKRVLTSEELTQINLFLFNVVKKGEKIKCLKQ